jgi:hypothetical protein
MNFSYIFFISLIFLNPINRLASLVKMIWKYFKEIYNFYSLIIKLIFIICIS